jgi:hypothetical protein
LHYPGEDKIEEFEAALKRKASAQDFDFRGVWFPVDFTVFQGIEVTDELRFDNAIFKKPVDFTGTVFKSAMHFQSCHFEDWARFTGAKFEEGVSFNDAHFKVWGDFTDARMNGLGVYEVHAKGELSFDRATLSNDVHIRDPKHIAKLHFRGSTFEKSVSFQGESGGTQLLPELDLWDAQVESPEKVTFSKCLLQPEWFLRVDASEFRFFDVHWARVDMRKALQNWRFSELNAPAFDTLSLCYRNLAENAEAHQRYEEASWFRYRSLEALRIKHARGWAVWELRWWYWALSGYGERVTRAALGLILIWLLFGALYTLPGVGFARWQSKASSQTEAAQVYPDKHGLPLGFRRAWTYSLEVMSFQKPEPPPASPAAHVLVPVQAILGALQAALLALAVRRRVSRAG